MEPQEEYIEKYLEGRLEAEELLKFEQRLKTDAAFASEVDSAKLFYKEIKSFGARKELKEQLNHIHSENFSEAKPKGFSVWINYRQLAIAASVALVTSIGSMLIIHNWTGSQNSGKAQYRELRRDVERIKQSQNKILKEINSEKSEIIHPHNFNGTGFAISSQGYVVTSYHVVQNEDSLLIENDKFKTLTAKVIYTDKVLDIAVLKVKDKSFKTFGRLPYSLQNSPKNLGDRIFTIGYPQNELVYGEGYIAGNTGFEDDTASYQISIPVNPGNSGGPMLDERGNVAGIITGKLTDTEGAAFALQTRIIKSVLSKIEKDSSWIRFEKTGNGSLTGVPRQQQIRKIREFVFKIGSFKEE